MKSSYFAQVTYYVIVYDGLNSFSPKGCRPPIILVRKYDTTRHSGHGIHKN